MVIKTKKGQVRLMETIAVLFIFFVLIVFGIIFYFQYQKSAFAEKQQQLLEDRAIQTVLKSLFMPEFQCTKGNAQPEDNCFDLMKLRHAPDIIGKNNLTYFNVFSFSRITVEKIYPVIDGKPKKFVLYDHPKKDFENKERTFFIVALKDYSFGEGLPIYGLGRLEIEVFS